MSEESSGGLTKRVHSSGLHIWPMTLLLVKTAKYITAAFEGKCISSFRLKSGEHGNSSKYREKNWKKKLEGMRLQKKNHGCPTESDLQWTYFKVVLVQYTVWLKILFLCHMSKFTWYKTSRFLVPYVLRYFVTHKVLKQATCKLFSKCHIAV